MPLIFHHLDAEREVGVWIASEGLSFFAESLGAQGFDIRAGERIPHPEKKLQWYASRYLLAMMYPEAITLYDDRKPYLYNGPFVSFSHSKKAVAVILSHINAGVDVQQKSPKLQRIAPKFLACNDLEVMDYPTRAIDDALGIIWSVKEAVFKTYGTNVPFKEIVLTRYDEENLIVHTELASAARQAKHEVAVKRIGDIYLAYLLK